MVTQYNQSVSPIPKIRYKSQPEPLTTSPPRAYDGHKGDDHMPHSFTMEYNLQNRSAAELFDKLSNLKTIGKMQQDFRDPNEKTLVYVQPMTVWKDGFKVLVVFHDLEGGAAKVGILSSCMRMTVIFDGGQNEKNCIEIRNAIASTLK